MSSDDNDDVHSRRRLIYGVTWPRKPAKPAPKANDAKPPPVTLEGVLREFATSSRAMTADTFLAGLAFTVLGMAILLTRGCLLASES